MKILHTADWHLGAYVGPQCDSPVERMEHTLTCLRYLVEVAEREHPDLILVAGDLFHQAKVWSDRCLVEAQAAARILKDLSCFAPVVVLYGTPNHDNPAAFDIMNDICLPNGHGRCAVQFITRPQLLTVETSWEGPIQVAGVPGVDRGIFRAQLPGLAPEDENRAITAATADIIRGLSSQLDPEIPSVLMAHHTVVGCILDNGQSVIDASEPVIEAATIDATMFDMVALGHIHRQQAVLSCWKPTFYCGSIDANSFNDEGNTQGFIIHTLVEDAVQGRRWWSMQPFFTPGRKFITIRSDIAGLDSIDGLKMSGGIVRVLYSGTDEQEKAMDRRAIERVLYAAGAEYVAEIRPESIEATVNRERLHESLIPDDCLRRYLVGKAVDTSAAEAIMAIAQPIISAALANAPAGGQTGMFLPLSLEVSNYRSYSSESLDFTQIFFAMVNGRNGVGKSSLFMDALLDCLFEQTREGELTGWIKAGERAGSIMFSFRLGDGIWRVTRTRARSGKASLALARMPVMNAAMSYNPSFPLNWEDHSAQKMADTQLAIVNLLGMDSDTFRSCVLIMQDAYGSFMEAKPDERMAVLGNLLGLGIYEAMEDDAKTRMRDINRKLNELKMSADRNTMERMELAPLLDRLDDLHRGQSAESNRIQYLRAGRDEIAAAAGNTAGLNADLNRANARQVEIKREFTTVFTRILTLRDSISTTEEYVASAPDFEAGHIAYQEAQAALAGLQGFLDRLNDMILRSDALDRESLAAGRTLDTTQRALDTVTRQIYDIAQQQLRLDALGNTDAALNAFDIAKTQQSELERALNGLDVELRQAEQKSQAETLAARTKLANAMRQQEMLNSAGCIDIGRAECKFLSEAKLIASTINELQHNVDECRDWLSSYKAGHTNSVIHITSKMQELGYVKENHDAALRNHRTAQALAMELAQSSAVYLQQKTFQERIEQLKESIAKALTEKTGLADEMARLKELCAGVESIKTRIRSHQEAEAQYNELPAARRYLLDMRPELEAAEQRNADLHKSLEASAAEITRLTALLAANQDTATALTRADAEINQAIATLSSINREMGSLEGRTARLPSLETEAAQLADAIRTTAGDASRMQMLAEAFGQDGIPHQIIRDIIPELEAQANTILSTMTGGRMRLQYRTEKVLKSNKAKEIATLDIVIHDVDNGELPYLSRSGGQKVRAALAQSFALAMIKASRVGLQLGMMFVDEPPFLDDEGSEAYCAALESIHVRYPEMRIVAISHNPAMKAFFPQQISVAMTENGSKITMD